MSKKMCGDLYCATRGLSIEENTINLDVCIFGSETETKMKTTTTSNKRKIKITVGRFYCHFCEL